MINKIDRKTLLIIISYSLIEEKKNPFICIQTKVIKRLF